MQRTFDPVKFKINGKIIGAKKMQNIHVCSACGGVTVIPAYSDYCS